MRKSARALDRIDLRILAALQADGRITNAALAERIGLSPSPCLERVRRLEQTGFIRRYTAEIDLSPVTRTVTVFAEVTLASHAQADFARFEAALSAEPAVVEAHCVGGGIDYVLRIVARDIADYHETSERLLASAPEVANLTSYVAIRRVKTDSGLPLDRLADPEA